jgi:hypothetical protein
MACERRGMRAREGGGRAGNADTGGGPGGKGTPADAKGGPDRKGAGVPADVGGQMGKGRLRTQGAGQKRDSAGGANAGGGPASRLVCLSDRSPPQLGHISTSLHESVFVVTGV